MTTDEPVVATRPDAGRFAVEERRGSAAVLHGSEPAAPGRPLACWCVADGPALVLGSAQDAGTVDELACAARGVAVARRRSGGGAVLVVPGEQVWLDVVVPRGDALWSDDVGRAMWWLGEVWAGALAELSPGAGEVAVHHGALERTRWSSVVCFDGLGAGEVVVGGAKAVGVSQRRHRDVARLQSSVHLRWRPELLVDLLAAPRPAVAELRPVHAVTADADAVRAAVEARLAQL